MRHRTLIISVLGPILGLTAALAFGRTPPVAVVRSARTYDITTAPRIELVAFWGEAPRFLWPTVEPEPADEAQLWETVRSGWNPPDAPRVSARAPARESGRPLTYNVEQWRGLVAQYWQAADVDFALCLIAFESGGDSNADNPRSSASGLMQHLASYWLERSVKAGWGGASIWDPEANIGVGAWLYYTGGAGHWTVHDKCGR